MSKADEPSSTIGIPLEGAIDCFLKLEKGDKWIRRLPDDEMNLIQWYLVEKQPCTPGLLKRAEDAFLRRAEIHQQRKDGERWVRTHVRRVKPPIETRTPVEWDDVESTHRIRSALEEIYSRAELERALLGRFGRLDEPAAADPAQAPATGTQPEESPAPSTQLTKPKVAEPAIETSEDNKSKQPKKRRGRPLQWDWGEGILFLLVKLDELGDPLDPLNQVDGWRSEMDAAKLVAAHIAKPDGTEPDPKYTWQKIEPEIAGWRSRQVGN